MVSLEQMGECIGFFSKNLPWRKINTQKLQEWLDKPKEFAAAVTKLINDGVPVVVEVVEKKVEQILRRLYPDEIITIGACDGKRTIAKSPKTFLSYLDPDFKNWGLDKPGVATEQMQVSVHEMAKDANLQDMFDSLNKNSDALCLTQHQIIDFCEKNTEKLRQQGYATLFLFKENNEFFVAYVRVYSGGLNVRVGRLGRDYVWLAEDRRRLVVRQLNL